MTHKAVVPCPRCQQAVTWGPEAPHKPFCSERCKLIDLGKWANDEHAIPGESVEMSLLNDASHLDD